jgi:phytoene/squalene synthetase
MTTPRRYIDFLEEVDFSRILTNPILDIAARVWEEDRYEAFKVCYRSMRVVDDLVDDLKAGPIDESIGVSLAVENMVRTWIDDLRQGQPEDKFYALLLNTIDHFRLPLWPWERLGEAMIYDLNHDGFPTFIGFMRYTEGAAIAPAAVFMHLCGVDRTNDDRYQPPVFDIREAARPLAVFSYLVHIMRDFQKDHHAGLNYFATSILEMHHVSSEDLDQSARTGHPTESVQNVFATYARLAEYYRQKARHTMSRVKPALAERYQLSWELIYELYNQIYQRVTPHSPTFELSAVQPEPEAVQACIQHTIETFQPMK